VKVFVDTNVWLAGRFGRGLCAELLDALIELGADVLLDERVLVEFRRIARDKFRVDAETLAETEIFFRQHTRLIDAASEPASGIPDPDDAWIVAAALEACADWFVTGDKELLELDAMETLAMLSPREAFTRLRGLD